MLRAKLERSAVTRCQQLGLAPVMSSINRTNGMNHVFRRKVSGRGDHGLAGREPLGILCPANFTASLQNRWPTGAVDGAVNAASTQESRVGRVNDRVNLVAGDVAYGNPHATAEKRG
jgi:hypothetical protein